MTPEEAYTSLKQLYKKLMFPPGQDMGNNVILPRTGWTMSDIDQMDVHFFDEMMQKEEEEKVYIDQIKLF